MLRPKTGAKASEEYNCSEEVKIAPATAPKLVGAQMAGANTQNTAVAAPTNIRSASRKAAAKIKEEADDAESDK